MKPNAVIIVSGNVVDGLEFVGPFEDEDEAVEYGEKHANDLDGWVLARVYKDAS